MRKTLAALFLSVLLLALTAFMAAASADDEALLWELPGEWVYTADYDEPLDLAVLVLEEDGTMSLRCNDENGSYAYTCGGTWELELTTEYSPDYGLQDKLTLQFTYTDDPRRAGSDYNVECVYYVYAESWIENETRYTFLITQDGSCSGVSPFTELCEEDGAAVLHREEAPNMRVVNCKKNVSLRQEPDKKSRRLAKVPLGALVFAFTEVGETDGFLSCAYHDEYGYILAEYLQPVK